MYLRTTQRKNKDGSIVRYVQLAHNEWCPDKGYARAQVVYNFGREDQLDLDNLRRLARSIVRYLGPEEVLASQAEDASRPLRFVGSKPLGGGWVLQQLWERLGIGTALQGLLKDRSYRAPVERALFALVANRALAPSSKRACEEWVREDVALPGVSDIAVQQFYRAMDFLLECEEALQREVFFSVADLLNIEVDLLFFDTTSTYFEVEEADAAAESADADPDYTLRRYGHSKDSRPDRPQAVIGLAVTREGIPVRCWVWPGNTADLSVVAQVKRDLVGWRLGRVVSVVDRGFVSDDNLRELQRTGGHYIAGERMASGKPSVEAALAHAGRYKSVRHNVEVKEVVIGDGEARARYVMVRNPEEAKRQRAQRDSIIESVQAELDHLSQLPQEQHTKAVCRLIAHKTYGRYLKQDKRGWPRLDRAKIKADERLDGKYLLRTSDDTLSAEDVALGYKQLLEVEDAFRTLKQSLELRPVYHRLSDRIRAHVLLCWLALLLIRVAEVEAERHTGRRQRWDRLRDELQRMHLGEFSGPHGTVFQRTETTPKQAEILAALSVAAPPTFTRIEPKTEQTA